MKKTRLLLVDDMPWVYEVAKIELSKRYIIDYARTEKQALTLIKNNKYGLVVSDYYLGKKSPKGGLKVVRAAMARDLPATLMSMENHRKEALKEKAKFIFKKRLSHI